MIDPVETERCRLRQFVLARSEAAARGEGDILDHARQVYRAWRRLEHLEMRDDGVRDNDEDRKFLLYVESELDRYPLGEERSLWASDALAELEPKLESMRDNWGARLVTILQKLRDEMSRTSQAGESK